MRLGIAIWTYELDRDARPTVFSRCGVSATACNEGSQRRTRVAIHVIYAVQISWLA